MPSAPSGPGVTGTVAWSVGQLGEQRLVVVLLAGAQGGDDQDRQALQPLTR